MSTTDIIDDYPPVPLDAAEHRGGGNCLRLAAGATLSAADLGAHERIVKIAAREDGRRCPAVIELPRARDRVAPELLIVDEADEGYVLRTSDAIWGVVADRTAPGEYRVSRPVVRLVAVLAGTHDNSDGWAITG
jgi:hypothetical protein